MEGLLSTGPTPSSFVISKLNGSDNEQVNHLITAPASQCLLKIGERGKSKRNVASIAFVRTYA